MTLRTWTNVNKRSRWYAYTNNTASCSHCVILMAFRSFVLSIPSCFWLVQDHQNAEGGVTTRYHSTDIIVDSNCNERFNWYRTELIEPRRKIVRFLLQHIYWKPGADNCLVPDSDAQAKAGSIGLQQRLGMWSRRTGRLDMYGYIMIYGWLCDEDGQADWTCMVIFMAMWRRRTGGLDMYGYIYGWLMWWRRAGGLDMYGYLREIYGWPNLEKLIW
jgi:hypothetical protein